MSSTHALMLAETLAPSPSTRSARRTLMATLDGTSASLPPPRAQAFAVGARINARYEVKRVIGAGGMGVVYRVTDAVHPERALALKTLRTDATSRAGLSLFKSEFRTMTRLRHPHVAQVYDFEPIAGGEDHFFTMDFVEGADALSATEGQDWRRVVELVVQACRALSYVHSRKVIHYDLKPENLLVDRSGSVKLVDFGIAGGALGDRDTIRGTPHYMPPELTGDVGEIDQRADLYSLGITAFELLYRRLPFDGATFLELLRQHHFEPLEVTPAEASRAPRWLFDVVRRLCAKRPDERFRHANAVIEAINAGGQLGYELETKETRESYVLAGGFVGREAEQAQLASFVRARTSGGEAPIAAMVTGQSGVGKSRLVRELRRLCQLQRLPFLEVDCHEAASSDHEPVVRALTFAVPLATSLGAGDLVERFGPQLKKLVPALLESALPAGAHPDPIKERAAVREAVAEFFLELGARVPLVLYVNDLQWAGEATSGVVRNLVYGTLARSERKSRLALLGSYRDDEVHGAPIASLLSDAREHLCTVELAPLPPGHVASLVQSMLGVEGLPPQLLEAVVRATGGSPFFVQELMRSLIEHGLVYLEAGQWSASAKVAELPVPERMDDVFRRRAAMLAATPRAVLEAITVHGKPLELEVLRRASGLSEDDLVEAIAVLRQRSMIRQVQGEHAAFAPAHDRVRETTAESLPVSSRRATHLALAEAYYAGTLGDERLSDAAHHYLEAQPDDPEIRVRAGEVLLAASKDASRAALYDTARRQLERAMAWLSEVGPGHAQHARASELLTAVRPQLLEVLYRIDAAEAERAFAGLLGAAGSLRERTELQMTRGYASIGRGAYLAAYEQSLEAIRALGYRAPRRPMLMLALLEYAWARLRLRGMSAEQIASLPRSEDPAFAAAMENLSVAGMASSWLGPAPATQVMARGTRWSIGRGLVVNATSILLGMGFVTLAVTGEIRRAWDFARAGMLLADAGQNRGRTGAQHGWGAAFVGVWCVPLAQVLGMLEKSFTLTLDRAGANVAASVANVWVTTAFFGARTATAWRTLVARHQVLFQSVEDVHAIVEVLAIDRMVQALRGEAASPLALDDGSIDRAVLEAQEREDPIAASLVTSFAARHAAIDEDWQRAEREAAASLRHAARAPVRQLFVAQAELVRFVALARTRPSLRARFTMRRLLARHEHLAALCPTTFGHYVAIMRAELHRLAARPREASEAYASAAREAEERGFVLDAALAEQLAAEPWLRAGAPDQARAHRERAAAHYERWGAAAVARRLRAMA